jgi:undecaprenyl-phosphate 4-deoxy-4-formamido-L-arabinose transferase
MMTGFSTLPLQIASVVGFAAMLMGIGLLGLVLLRYFLHGVSVPGFTFLASIICVFSGTQLFTLGMIGEYLARMHFRMMDRPSYTVQIELGANARPAV